LKLFDKSEIEKALTYPELVDKLEDSFSKKYELPPSLHYSFDSGEGMDNSTLLLMPAWKNKAFVGLKVITASQYNSKENLDYSGYLSIDEFQKWKSISSVRCSKSLFLK